MLDEVEVFERNIKWEPLSTLTYFVVVLAVLVVVAVLPGFVLVKYSALTYPVFVPAFTSAQPSDTLYTNTAVPFFKLSNLAALFEGFALNVKLEFESTLTYFVSVFAAACTLELCRIFVSETPCTVLSKAGVDNTAKQSGMTKPFFISISFPIGSFAKLKISFYESLFYQNTLNLITFV
ncbi:hypothetical protein MAHJHV51_47050 [Mycobacterium avium subsp. hominissuis]